MMSEQKERPILFSAPMVRAILEGRKTQTRRIVKPQPIYDDGLPYSKLLGPELYEPAIYDKDGDMEAGPEVFGIYTDDGEWGIKCPYGQPGDRLWVRETWAHDAGSLEQCRVAHEDIMRGISYGPYYRATESAPETLKWRPSIHMPRWASRITLEITGVRVERLQGISKEDAKQEGVWRGSGDICGEFYCREKGRGLIHRDPRDAFKDLWESINGPGSWALNPWVWVVEFKRVID